MPRLLAFIPCEKVVRDEAAKNASLFTVLEEVHVTVPLQSGPPPRNTFSPMTWAIYSLWEKEEADEGKTFEVKHVFVGPDNEILIDGSVIELRFTTLRHQLTGNIVGFPIWVSGRCELQLKLRDSPHDYMTITSFPIQVFHDAQAAPSTS